MAACAKAGWLELPKPVRVIDAPSLRWLWPVLLPPYMLLGAGIFALVGALPARAALGVWLAYLVPFFAARAAASVALRRFFHNSPPPGACARCGYDLRATPHRCPECGATPADRP